MNKMRRNRAILVIVVALVALGIYLVQTEGIYDIVGACSRLGQPQQQSACTTCGKGLQAGDIIEALVPNADVLGYTAGRPASEGGDVTPTIRIGLVYYGADPFEMPKHIVLTETGYKVILGELKWDPNKAESDDERLHEWNMAKYYYYLMNGMFTPKQKSRVEAAFAKVYEGYSDAMDRQLLYGIFVAAAEETAEWNRIVVELLTPVPRQQLTSHGVEVEIDLYVRARLMIFKKGTWAEWIDGKEVSVEWQPHMAVPAQGELTEEDWDHLVESQQMTVRPGGTMWGPELYRGTINHPVREMK